MLTAALRLAYDGGRFDSYARMPGRDTVEDALLAALHPEGYVEGTFRTGSRTDAGVSALENCCRATFDRPHLQGLVPAVQRNLPDGLWVTAATEVPDTWNPRHARRRRYRYFAFDRGEALAPMQQAAAAFVGRHDMRAFARLEEGRDPQRNVFAFEVAAGPDGWEFAAEGDGFLWNQVRRMVGATLAVGRGEAPPEAIAASLASGTPHPRFRLVAAEGLVLEQVAYDGLAWDPKAGRLGPQLVGRMHQDARARMRLARHLRELAPWPA
ncbi:MAG: tRNA pseudouridine38-40 synthase [Thermoplasmata archaeon]|nr:tRNA pseudouridine38-40 synthase [Thermoplasmata archaeon]